MSENITLDTLKQNLDFLGKTFDAARLVDPVLKRVIDYQNKAIGKTNKACCEYWEKGCIEDTCICLKAYFENKSFFKLEQTSDSILLVVAIPVEGSESPLVLELLKDTTSSMLIGAGEYDKGQLMHRAVNDISNIVSKDYLTSLYNRRFLDDRLPIDVVSATINKAPLSVIFIDVDSMKCINDTFGHSAGDEVLKHTANTIKNYIRRATDWAARYGGDEFFVCLNHTCEKDAKRIAERIEDDISLNKVNINSTKIQVTVSSGVFTMLDSTITAEEIISKADKKMYEEKKRHKGKIN